MVVQASVNIRVQGAGEVGLSEAMNSRQPTAQLLLSNLLLVGLLFPILLAKSFSFSR
jgi:hypothetical protein